MDSPDANGAVNNGLLRCKGRTIVDGMDTYGLYHKDNGHGSMDSSDWSIIDSPDTRGVSIMDFPNTEGWQVYGMWSVK